MTIDTTSSPFVGFAGDGGTTEFAFNYPVTSVDFIAVRARNNTSSLLYGVPANSTAGLTEGSDYTVTLTNGGDDGGTVDFAGLKGAPPTGITLVIYRQTDIKQTTDYIENGPFPAETHEEALDYLTLVAQEMNASAIKVPATLLPNAPFGTGQLPEPPGDGQRRAVGFDVNNNLSFLTFTEDSQANVAYTDVQNLFSEDQSIAKDAPSLLFRDAPGVADSDVRVQLDGSDFSFFNISDIGALVKRMSRYRIDTETFSVDYNLELFDAATTDSNVLFSMSGGEFVMNDQNDDGTFNKRILRYKLDDETASFDYNIEMFDDATVDDNILFSMSGSEFAAYDQNDDGTFNKRILRYKLDEEEVSFDYNVSLEGSAPEFTLYDTGTTDENLQWELGFSALSLYQVDDDGSNPSLIQRLRLDTNVWELDVPVHIRDSTNPNILLIDNNTTDRNAKLEAQGAKFNIKRVDDDGSSPELWVEVDLGNGETSFYSRVILRYPGTSDQYEMLTTLLGDFELRDSGGARIFSFDKSADRFIFDKTVEFSDGTTIP